ncbi:DeoR/GlpR family DNA-binding transcription regulator [Lacticigenium naphthae]|uniref:DeoR/GlpR family DNA-binding transcription regulator n=1 Tax=Lacticigenium naphthae TaxID=515351 RepID=UPI00041ED4AC|nr:DeoR/GlpR family DNA-binding transcription regulator [Lacticigenium naphthae]
MHRDEKIISIVSEEKKIEVNELATRLGVSKVTMRKDLDKLETRGIINRQHGYALINNEDDINYRLAVNYELKLNIAKKAAESVKDGDTVMIESGSSCTLLAEELAKQKKNITIITNSTFIASYIRKLENVHIILLGGEYQKDSQVNVGPLLKKVIENFYVDKLFVGIDGFDENRGFMGSDLARCDAAQIMAESARKTIVLTDSSKFLRRGMVAEFSFEEIFQVYTDKEIESEKIILLQQKGIEVVLT